MKLIAWKEMINKRKTIVIILLILCIGFLAGGLYYYRTFVRENEAVKDSDNRNNQNAVPTMSENMVSASGTTMIGIHSEELELSFIENTLYIESLYLSTGEEVEAGQKILKIAEEDIEEARKTLKDAVTETNLAYRAGVVEYEYSKLTAQYDYDTAILNSQLAQEIYEDTLLELQDAMDKAEKELTEAKEDIAEYTDAVTNDTYYTEYEVGITKDTYDENREILTKLVEEWDIPYSAFISSTEGGGNNAAGGGAMGEGYDSSQLQTLKLLYAELQENEQEYEKAQEEYEEALEEAQINLNSLNASLPALQAAYDMAAADMEEKSVEAQSACDTAMAKCDTAKNDYDTAIKKAEETLQQLEDDKKDAQDNLEKFEEILGDGYLYTESRGVILMLAAEEEEDLVKDGMVLAYSNPEEISVTVSVDQNDISKLDIGDIGTVIMEEYGMFQGKITTINPISASNSRTSITYNVEVILEGDTSALSENLTATVIFGMEGEQTNEVEE